MTDSKEQLHGTITARAELDRAFARLIIEDVTSVMSKNISTVLQMMEQQHREAMGVLGVAALDIKKLVTDVSDLELRMKSSEHDRKDMRDRLTRLEAVNERLKAIEIVLAARPAQREQEHQALLEAITKQAQRGD